ncbi:MAG: ABC transporter permease [Acidobacteria bacterium]|nr:ABC transporter permease [Acidobacteriota bacterium]
MKVGELLAFALGALRGHRLRTSLSVAGVAVGIAAVVALTALGDGARTYVVREFSSLGSNLLIVIPGKVETTGAIPFGGVTHDLTVADARSIAMRVPGVVRVAPIAVATDAVHWADRSRSVPILGVTAAYQAARQVTVASGRFLETTMAQGGGQELVLGAKVAHELFRGSSPLGRIVRVGAWRYRVVGVMAPKGRSLGFDFDDLVFIPVKTAMRMFNRTSLFRILVEVPSADELAPVKRRVTRLLNERHRADDVTVITQDAVLSAFSSILGVLTLALAGLASVSLSVAGVGIMNVMLVAVSERRREIGILKALGATNRQVLGAFLAEAVVLSTTGGLLGLAAGAAGVRVFVAFYPSFPASPPAWSIAAAMGVAVAVGVGFGVWPARRATRLDPVTALRGR